jgi:hypothetical protein
MPELSRFYGIVIQMYYGDHPPPHFHALYSGHTAKLNLGLVVEWAELHQDELREAFRQAAALQRPSKIDPLP